LSNVMDTKDMLWHRHIVTGIRNPKIPGPGAVAHMSLHLNQQCQRATRQKQADNDATPLFGRGTCCPFMLATDREAVVAATSPSVERHIWRVLDSVNAFLQKCCNRQGSSGFLRVFGPRERPCRPARHRIAMPCWRITPRIVAVSRS
jgi:hypothetical protein